MTVQQEAAKLINGLPDDSARAIIELIKTMMPAKTMAAPSEDTSRRFGAGKGIITDSPIFDELDAEIEEMFTGESA